MLLCTKGYITRVGYLHSGGVALLTYFTLGSPWHITLGGIAGLIVAAAQSRPPQKNNPEKNILENTNEEEIGLEEGTTNA